MKLMARRAWSLMIVCILFAAGTVFLLYSYINDAPRWATYPVNRHLYSSGRLINAGAIYDRNSDVLAATENGVRRYSDSAGVRKALMHLTGDADGNVATGLQVSYRRALTGWSYLSGAYSYGGTGGNNITTTVDAPLCRAAYEALDGRHGVVGIMNYKTGELLCMVSSPTFDPQKPPAIDEDSSRYEGVYLNRLLSSSFPPGSIFKLVTAAAALDTLPDLSERIFTCEGALELEGGHVTCPHVHGKQDFGQILTNSCNVAFAGLAVEMGPQTLTQYAEKAGFNNQNMRLDDIRVSGGSFTLEDAGEADLGWAGVGQYKTLVNPLSYLQFVGSIANGGQRARPRIIGGIHGAMNIPLKLTFSAPAGYSLSGETAGKLKSMMRANVLNNYGEGKLKGYDMCAKTGTAEVGGGRAPHSWFAGFLDSETAPLCFIVLVENGGAGSAAAAGVAKKVLAEAVKLKL